MMMRIDGLRGLEEVEILDWGRGGVGGGIYLIDIYIYV